MRALILFLLTILLLCRAQNATADDWPQWLGPQRDSVWRENGIVTSFPPGGPSVVWRAEVGGGYSGPCVAQGKVFVIDRQLSTNAVNPNDPFARGRIPGVERVTCFDAATGRQLWRFQYDCPYTVSYPAGPRATPLAADGKVFTLGAEGNLYCLDAATGAVLWSRDFKKDYNVPTPMWGFAGNPLLDGNRLICLAGGTNSTFVALDKDTGREIWRALGSKEPGYCSPVIFNEAGVRQLIAWDPESVSALNPETGEVYWSTNSPHSIRSGMTIPTPRKMGDLLYLTCFYDGSWMLKLDPSLPAASTLWRSARVSEMNTDALHSTLSTPFLDNGYIYGVCSYGQLRCLDATNGNRIWETMAVTTPDGKEARWANAFIVKNGNRFFLFNEKGDLIIARLSPKGYEELSRAHIIDPVNRDTGRLVVWSHPAFANRRIYARNDKELICVDLAAKN
ncbi:MAG TPA: PQQ-binding-like beta-propeller repeat protein [Verrucomicrobiae bacterium]|jgi:outer membrane protein assembly factor BamB